MSYLICTGNQMTGFYLKYNKFRDSHQRWSIEKAVLKSFAIFTGKHLCWSLFLIKLHAFRPATLLKRDSYIGVFLLLL